MNPPSLRALRIWCHLLAWDEAEGASGPWRHAQMHRHISYYLRETLPAECQHLGARIPGVGRHEPGPWVFRSPWEGIELEDVLVLTGYQLGCLPPMGKGAESERFTAALRAQFTRPREEIEAEVVLLCLEEGE